jgi:DNA-binding XRE family transcriptional regulator
MCAGRVPSHVAGKQMWDAFTHQLVNTFTGSDELIELPDPPLRRALRYGARITLAEAASMIGVSPVTVWTWEGGRRPRDLETRRRYAELLDEWALRVGIE